VLKVRRECEVWARKMERACRRRPCKNKELVFFLVRKSVNAGEALATRLLFVASNGRMCTSIEVWSFRSGVSDYEKVCLSRIGKSSQSLNSVYPIN